MKTKLTLLAALLFSLPAFAVTFDLDAFGTALNGWDKKRTANYTFTDAKYRTHLPTITPTPSGGIFVATRIDLLSGVGTAAICNLHLTFSSSGTLESAQIKGNVGHRSLDTGVVRRPDAPAAPAAAEGAVPVPAKPFHATDELVAELFSSFDGEMKRLNTAAEAEKRDLFARLAGKPAHDLSAALRHNLNLILRSVRR